MNSPSDTPAGRRLAALVLAAGSASRFGSDKLSAPLEGSPLLFHAIRAARAAPVDRVIVVARPDLAIGQWQDGPAIETVRVTSTALSTSLQAGVKAAGDVDGLFVFLGDMPRVPHAQAGRLVALIGANRAALPRCAGRPGHPVLLDARAFPEIALLTGDRGAGALLKTWPDVVYDECEDPTVLIDVDHPADLNALTGTAASH